MVFVFKDEVNDIMLEMPDDLQDLVYIGYYTREEMCIKYKQAIAEGFDVEGWLKSLW